MLRKSFKIICISACIFLLLLIFLDCPICQAKSEESQLYTVRLQSLFIDQSLTSDLHTIFGKKGSNTYLYVSLFIDGKLNWISPKKKVLPGQTHFEWPNDFSACSSFFWSPKTPITVKAFFSDDALEAAAVGGAIGVAGGATSGALIGGIVAGAISGGIGAPVGALIGAAIGGAAGGAGGIATGAISAEDKLVFEKSLRNCEEFPLLEDVVVSEINNLGESLESKISFISQSKMTPIGTNQLELQKKYLVRIKEIELSAYAWQKGGEDLNKNRYYLVLRNGESTIRWPKNDKEYFSYNSQMLLKPELLVILANSGEETEIAIYSKRKLWKDKLVFSSQVAKLDGKNWVFQGVSYSSDPNDRSSKIVCETYGPLQ